MPEVPDAATSSSFPGLQISTPPQRSRLWLLTVEPDVKMFTASCKLAAPSPKKLDLAPLAPVVQSSVACDCMGAYRGQCPTHFSQLASGTKRKLPGTTGTTLVRVTTLLVGTWILYLYVSWANQLLPICPSAGQLQVGNAFVERGQI